MRVRCPMGRWVRSLEPDEPWTVARGVMSLAFLAALVSAAAVEAGRTFGRPAREPEDLVS